MPGIIPPDPGVVRDPSRAIALAKITEHEKLTGGFRHRPDAQIRWLRRECDRLLSSASGELRVSAETHAILKHARPPNEDGVFESERDGAKGLFVLEEDGFEARAVPA